LLHVAISFLAGALLGAFFFIGLWWTVNRLTAVSRPYLLATASFLVRTAVILAGFYLLLAGGWQQLTAALAGFLAARTLVTYRVRPHNAAKKGG